MQKGPSKSQGEGLKLTRKKGAKGEQKPCSVGKTRCEPHFPTRDQQPGHKGNEVKKRKPRVATATNQWGGPTKGTVKR